MDDHGHDHNGKNIGWAILINIGITVTEAIGGTLSGSLALLSDAGHNLSDVHLFYDALSSVVVIGSGLLIFLTGWVILDLAVSLLIAGMVL